MTHRHKHERALVGCAAPVAALVEQLIGVDVGGLAKIARPRLPPRLKSTGSSMPAFQLSIAGGFRIGGRKPVNGHVTPRARAGETLLVYVESTGRARPGAGGPKYAVTV